MIPFFQIRFHFYSLVFFFVTVHFFLFTSPAQAQPQPYGLHQEYITDLSLFASNIINEDQYYLCAGTVNNGVYIRNLSSPDSLWRHFGLSGKTVTAVHAYQWGAGPATFHTLFAAIQRTLATPDSTLIYRFTFGLDSTWVPSDSGFPSGALTVRSMAGFYYEGHLPPGHIFAVAGSAIYRSSGFPTELFWESLPQTEGMLTLQIYPPGIFGSDETIWAGGGNAIMTPVIRKSTDFGNSWISYAPPTGSGDCTSIAKTAYYPDTVYAGISLGSVIKTTDGGINWAVAGLQGNFMVTGVTVNPADPQHVIAGGIGDEFWVLFETFDGGTNWAPIVPITTVKGIECLTADVAENEFVVYLGTRGDGVWRYAIPISGIPGHLNDGIVPQVWLYQNYPNPFNPETAISYQLSAAGNVELAIYNLLGQKVRALVRARQPAGRYEVQWDGRDEAGREVGSGVYIYRLKAGDPSTGSGHGFVQSRKMLLLR